MSIPGFVKIFTLGDRNTARIWHGDVEITEKVDGSQFSFMVNNGELLMRSKGAMVHRHDGNKMFNKATEYVTRIFEEGLLKEGVIYHGEYLQSPRHNTLEYERTPTNYFALYGMRVNGEFITNHATLAEEAKRIGCDVVPLLFKGNIADLMEGEDKVEFFKKFIDRTSYLGKAKIEGLVVKNYNENILVGGQLIPILCGKFVSEQFKEKHEVSWKANNPDKLTQLSSAFKSEARWEKAIQHLRDDGKLTDTPKDIGDLMKEISRDLDEEEKEFIKEELWKMFSKDIKRIALGGVAEWYKQKLATEHL